MTNATETPEAPSLPPEPQSPPPPPTRGQPLTREELGRRILGKSGLEIGELLSLPAEDKYDIAGSPWENGQSPPGNAALLIVALFVGDQHDEQDDHITGDVRAYVMPRDATSGDTRQEFRKYTLNRGAPTLRSTRYSLEAFIEEIGGEWYDLAVVKGVVEPEEEEEPEGEE